MLTLFRAVIERVKVLLATAAAADLEADFLARDAERKAELLRRADAYAAEGFPTVAAGLRRQAEDLDTARPGGAVLPALAHWLGGESVPTPLPALTGSRKRTGR